jgi:hypothetical protein
MHHGFVTVKRVPEVLIGHFLDSSFRQTHERIRAAPFYPRLFAFLRG